MTDVVSCWQAAGSSVRGAAHQRGGLPNQDALQLPDPAAGLPLVLALADGHGSPHSFRSDRGARLAVAAAHAVCRQLPAAPATTALTAIKRWAEDALPRQLICHWRETVDCDLAADLFTPDELGCLGIEHHNTLRRYLAYGATLLVVVVAATFVFYLQLGDGDILAVSDEGRVSRPLPQDERLLANVTTSLCSPQAWRDVRFSFQALINAPPALILAATDGYANSYRDETGFLQVGADLLASIRAEGLAPVAANLASWLDEVSREGSGDDVTVGLLYRTIPPEDAHG